MIIRGYKVQLEINNKQQTILAQHLGVSRWAYNWAVAKKKEAFYNKERVPNHMELSKELVKLKKTEIPWMYNSSKFAPETALKDCDAAFKAFCKNRKKKNIKKKKKFIKFKSKYCGIQSFRLGGESISVGSDYIVLPRIGKLKLIEKNYIPKDYKIYNATVSKRAGKWFVSAQVEIPDITPVNAINDVVGVDLGIKTLATCSNGDTFENPKALRNNLKRLKRLQRQVSRRKIGSNNYVKAKQKLAKLHYRISNIRKDCLHKTTSEIIDKNQVIILEDLRISNMLKNHTLALSISDVGAYEFRRQTGYKADWNNREVIFADSFYPSSKLCSSCGHKNEDLTLKDRTFECKVCNNKIDRDLNASLNLKSLYTGSFSEF